MRRKMRAIPPKTGERKRRDKKTSRTREKTEISIAMLAHLVCEESLPRFPSPRECRRTDRRASEEIFAVDPSCFLFHELDRTDVDGSALTMDFTHPSVPSRGATLSLFSRFASLPARLSFAFLARRVLSCFIFSLSLSPFTVADAGETSANFPYSEPMESEREAALRAN